MARDEERHSEALARELGFFPAGIERARPLRDGKGPVWPTDAQLGARPFPGKRHVDGSAEGAGALDERRDDALDPLAVGGEREGSVRMQGHLAIETEAPYRAQRRIGQLAQLARLLVEDEAAHFQPGDLEHLFEQAMEPLRLTLENGDGARVEGLTFLEPAAERVCETLDAGERRLQLVSGETEKAILPRLALGGRE